MTNIIEQPIQQKTFINLPIEQVYDAITSPDCWNSFFTSALEIELKVGGKMRFVWENWGPDFYTNDEPCEVVVCDKPSNFTFKWGKKMVSTVEFNLTSEFGGTVIHVKEYGYPNSDEGISSMLSCASGWGEAVTLLKFYLEHGIVYTQPKKIT